MHAELKIQRRDHKELSLYIHPHCQNTSIKASMVTGCLLANTLSSLCLAKLNYIQHCRPIHLQSNPKQKESLRRRWNTPPRLGTLNCKTCHSITQITHQAVECHPVKACLPPRPLRCLLAHPLRLPPDPVSPIVLSAVRHLASRFDISPQETN